MNFFFYLARSSIYVLNFLKYQDISLSVVLIYKLSNLPINDLYFLHHQCIFLHFFFMLDTKRFLYSKSFSSSIYLSSLFFFMLPSMELIFYAIHKSVYFSLLSNIVKFVLLSKFAHITF